MTTPKPHPGTYSTLPDNVYVYRIENYRHHGAYQTYRADHIWPDDALRHPAPGRDGLGMVRSYDYHFGFKSMDDFRAWFGAVEIGCLNRQNRDCCYHSTITDDPYEIEDELNAVQHLVVLSVPRAHVVFGEHQLAFANSYADRIMTLPLDMDLLAQL